MFGERNETAAVAHAGPLAFLGAIIAGIAGWLLSAGALPRPGFLPLPPAEPIRAGLLYAAIGLVLGGVIGGIAHLADRAQDEEMPPATAPEQQPAPETPAATPDESGTP